MRSGNSAPSVTRRIDLAVNALRRDFRILHTLETKSGRRVAIFTSYKLPGAKRRIVSLPPRRLSVSPYQAAQHFAVLVRQTSVEVLVKYLRNAFAKWVCVRACPTLDVFRGKHPLQCSDDNPCGLSQPIVSTFAHVFVCRRNYLILQVMALPGACLGGEIRLTIPQLRLSTPPFNATSRRQHMSRVLLQVYGLSFHSISPSFQVHVQVPDHRVPYFQVRTTFVCEESGEWKMEKFCVSSVVGKQKGGLSYPPPSHLPLLLWVCADHPPPSSPFPRHPARLPLPHFLPWPSPPVSREQTDQLFHKWHPLMENLRAEPRLRFLVRMKPDGSGPLDNMCGCC